VIGATMAALARGDGWSYLEPDRPTAAPETALLAPVVGDGRMVHQTSTQQSTLPGHRRFGDAGSVVVAAAAVVCTVLLAGAALLWFHYGTAVFFEMIASGIAACI
jgi:hypothetical protein